jgi:hypothetical protein
MMVSCQFYGAALAGHVIVQDLQCAEARAAVGCACRLVPRGCGASKKL